MPSINWDSFKKLDGGPRENFEKLCRSIVKRNFAQYGVFAALANQPGVEFHLRLLKDCSLGEKGRWFGWQCRYYELSSGEKLGSTRRSKIENSIEITKRELPDLTDWILWTRKPLTKDDQKWFFGLQSKASMKLELWTEDDIENLLSGYSEILRDTYFGELIITKDDLTQLHSTSVARIRKRWLPDAHQIVEAERILRQMIGESKSWDNLLETANKINSLRKILSVNSKKLKGELAKSSKNLFNLSKAAINNLITVHKLICDGDLGLLQHYLEQKPLVLNHSELILPRKLRSMNNFGSVVATNIIAEINYANQSINNVKALFEIRIVGILADAGDGKTQLSAQLTSPSDTRPAGILLYGQDLHSGENLNTLANKVILPGRGKPIASIESLIAAVDAAGQRSGCRLPIVIDGLNEAEDPRNWKAPLAELNERLKQYPYVLVVCTIRTGTRLASENIYQNRIVEPEERKAFVKEAFPEDITLIEIPDFGEDTISAIKSYFEYYRINPGDAELPFELLKHPLTLRLFCDVTNPKREKEVGVEAMPGSLTALFEKYLEQSAERIGFLSPQKYSEQDVRIVYDKLGEALWINNSREIGVDEFRKYIKDETRKWNESIIRSLEQEGVIVRFPGNISGKYKLMALYDALGGHLIATSVLNKIGGDKIGDWISKLETLTKIQNHPLSKDLLRALVSLIPRKLNKQLWNFLEEPLRTITVHEVAGIEGKYLDANTINEILKLVLTPSPLGEEMLWRLFTARSAPNHPLNANSLDNILRSMKITARDLRWTEWIRNNKEKLFTDLINLEEKWKSKATRTPSDKLRAEWVKWLLTSTIRILRDKATYVLYLFGLEDAEGLFKMTISSISINDPYVPERMIAASYGVAMTLHGKPENEKFKKEILSSYATELFNLIFAKEAPYSTTHALIRDYARHTIQLALVRNPDLLKAQQIKRIVPPFKEGGIRKWKRRKEFEEKLSFGYSEPLRTDFANYTMGHLVPGRNNYDFNNKEFRNVIENFFWRLEQLGYSPEKFKEVDKIISSDHYSSRSELNESRVDRYGKKYSWIIYFELYGYRYDNGLLQDYLLEDERPSDIDIDPSFPKEANNIQIVVKDFLGNRKFSFDSWIEKGGMPNIKPYLVIKEIKGIKGPWVLLNGFITQEEKKSKRGIFIVPRGFFITKKQSNKVGELLKKKNSRVSRLPEVPKDYYTFAGEIPWSDRFSINEFSTLEIYLGKHIKKYPIENNELFKNGKILNSKEREQFISQLEPLLEKKDNGAIEKLFMSKGIIIQKIKTYEKKEEPIIELIDVLIPVRNNNWESYHSGINPGQNIFVPAREIGESLNLSISPFDWSMYDADGNIASFSINWGNHWDTGHNLCYLRKDLLDIYLRKEKLEFIWVSWGDREIKMELDEQRSKMNEIKKWQERFEKVYFYNEF